jgi:hypothetical protein
MVGGNSTIYVNKFDVKEKRALIKLNSVPSYPWEHR